MNVMFAVLLLVLGGNALAFSIPLINPGFEDDVVPSDNYVLGVPSGWTAFTDGGLYFPVDGAAFAGNGISGAQSGDQYVIQHSEHGHVTLRQEVAGVNWADLQAGETLTIRMWTTYRNDVSTGNVYVWLNDSDGAGLYNPFNVTDGGATPPGVWTERVWQYTVTQANIDAGWGPVEIQIGFLHTGGANQVAFDNISLEYSGQLPAITLVSPKEFQGGNRVATDTVLVWDEALSGSLTNPGFDVYMDPNETFVTNLDPAVRVSSKQSTFSYDPELDPNTIYYWRVATYLDIDDTEPNQVTEVRSFRTVYVDEHWSGSPWTDDSNSGISVGKVYTHKVNFNASEAASTYVNGVYFENDTNRTGLNWTMAGALGTAGGSHHVAGDGGALVTNIYHGELPLAVLTLTGLMPGTDYVLTQYTRGWGNPGGREVNITTSADGRTTTLDGNILGDGNGYLYKYAYTAPASGELTLTFDPLTSNSWHHYAFSNELVVPAYVDPAPLPGASVNYDVELSWVLQGDVINPTYNLKVATDAAMTNLVVNEPGLTVTALTPFLNNDTTYYWQVEIVEDGSTVLYISPVWSFITTPPQPALKVIEWKFDEIIGTIAEQTGPTEDADGILVGFNDPNTPGVSHVTGLVNNGLLLNGKDEYVNVSNASVYMPTADGQSFAISGYLRTFNNYGPLFSMRNSDDGQPIIDIALGADGIQNEPGRICLLVRDDQTAAAWTNSGITVNDGRWHNFIVTRTDGIWKLYIDGILRGNINGAATGNVNLDLLGIGTSLRWIADGWGLDATYSAYRDFKGIVDEYTVWDGELQPGQIEALASILPPQGDIDFDLDTDIDDLTDLTADWLGSTYTPVQSSPVVLEDMESYTNDPNTFKEYWAYTPEVENYGLVTSLSMVPDPNSVYGQVMRLDYNMNGKFHTHIPFRLLDRRVNSSLYDRLTMRIRKLPGCESNRLILDFYDGRDKVDPVVEGMYPKGRLEVDFAAAPMDEWVTMDWTIPQTLAFTACTDLYQIMVSLQDGGADVGSVLIDSIELIDGTENCVPVVGQMVPDMNGDCVVDLLDFAEVAKGWLDGL
jgi:hypothetical protein